ncbi:hypothetical protein ACYOEI_15405, partial [Singulisphaera rosea]
MESSEQFRQALDAIVAAPLAWSSSEDLAALGIAPGTLQALEDEGWIERWEFPGGESVWTLTPIGAAMHEPAPV